MNENNIIIEYADILKRYMKKFSLEVIDIAYLAKSIRKTISSILNLTGSLKLETADAIANAFGLRYYEFGNPKHPIPSFESLPKKTKQRIVYREKEGPSTETKYNQSEIINQITYALSNYNVSDNFLAEDVSKLIFEKYGSKYSVSEIIDRFNKSFKENIEKTGKKDTTREGRGPKPVFYRLIRK